MVMAVEDFRSAILGCFWNLAGSECLMRRGKIFGWWC